MMMFLSAGPQLLQPCQHIYLMVFFQQRIAIAIKTQPD